MCRWLIELVDPQTAVDNCLRYKIERAGPQYETAFGVDRYPDPREYCLQMASSSGDTTHALRLKQCSGIATVDRTTKYTYDEDIASNV